MSDKALGPDELAISYQVREFGPLNLSDLYQICFVNDYPHLQAHVRTALDGLIEKGDVILKENLYQSRVL